MHTVVNISCSRNCGITLVSASTAFCRPRSTSESTNFEHGVHGLHGVHHGLLQDISPIPSGSFFFFLSLGFLIPTLVKEDDLHIKVFCSIEECPLAMWYFRLTGVLRTRSCSFAFESDHTRLSIIRTPFAVDCSMKKRGTPRASRSSTSKPVAPRKNKEDASTQLVRIFFRTVTQTVGVACESAICGVTAKYRLGCFAQQVTSANLQPFLSSHNTARC